MFISSGGIFSTHFWLFHSVSSPSWATLWWPGPSGSPPGWYGCKTRQNSPLAADPRLSETNQNGETWVHSRVVWSLILPKVELEKRFLTDTYWHIIFCHKCKTRVVANSAMPGTPKNIFKRGFRFKSTILKSSRSMSKVSVGSQLPLTFLVLHLPA